MPTEAELKSEQVWRDQFVPPNLNKLVAQLEQYYDPGVINIGAYGDYRHLRGYHRSRHWILRSRFCTNDSYSVTETIGNRSGGDGNWISGVDIVVGYTRSSQIYERVSLARQRGILRWIRELKLERDPWHVHVGIDRAHANDNHDDLFAVITGRPPQGGTYVDINMNLPVLRQGSEGGDVVTVQSLLTARGHATKLDGGFGPHTHEQTLAMQRQYGAEAVDGVWGPETWTIGVTGEDRR